MTHKNIGQLIIPTLLSLFLIASSCYRQPGQPQSAQENYTQQLTELFNTNGLTELSTQIKGNHILRHNGDLLFMSANSIALENSDTVFVSTASDTAHRVYISGKQKYDKDNPEHRAVLGL